MADVLPGRCALCLFQFKFVFKAPTFSVSFWDFTAWRRLCSRFCTAVCERSTAGWFWDIFGDVCGWRTPQEDVMCLFLRPSKTTGHHKRTRRPLCRASSTVPLEPSVLRHVCQHKGAIFTFKVPVFVPASFRVEVWVKISQQ